MKLKLIRHSIFNYPSGSAVEYYNNVLYLIGDDVNYVLCLDSDWNPIKEIKLFDFEGKRIPKPEKPDLECATIIDDILYIIGSGSRSPQRDVAFIVHLSDDTVNKINTASFYSLFRDMGLVDEMNIEGFTDCKDRLLFFNRGNSKEPNRLMITDRNILKKLLPDRFKVMRVKAGTLNTIPLGISGACYDEELDVLFLTASAENTDNAYDDGEITGSVLGVVYNAYKKLDEIELIIDEVIEMETIDSAFNKQKIESVCITKSNGKTFNCVLVADNDDGNSALFEVEISINPY